MSLCAKIGYMYYCEYAHLLKKHTEHTCMSTIYYDQGSDIKAKQCKTIVTFDTIPESKILDAGDLLILSNLQKPWTIACKDISRVFEIEYSTYRILNRSELCKCSLTAGNYLLSYTNINCGNYQKYWMSSQKNSTSKLMRTLETRPLYSMMIFQDMIYPP